jgi:hypothetical protein
VGDSLATKRNTNVTTIVNSGRLVCQAGYVRADEMEEMAWNKVKEVIEVIAS